MYEWIQLLNQAIELIDHVSRTLFSISFCLFMVYEFAAFFRFLLKRWRDESKPSPSKT
jgi:hypothetical protein